jgi:adenylate kinase
MLNIVLFGPPGSGKGTQSEKLIAKFKLKHLSTGDLFRDNITRQTELGKRVKEYTDNGILVPDEVTINMLEAAMNDSGNVSGYIFDGFPRTVAQAEALDKMLKKRGTSISSVIALDVDQQELKNRLLNRGKTSGRSDDEESKIIRRMDEYFQKTILVLPYYGSQGKLSRIQGIGEIDQIFSRISSIVEGSR